MNKKKNSRAALYTLAGMYLVYLAYNLFKGLGEQTGTEHVIGLTAMIVFAVVGIGLTVSGLRSGVERMKDMGEPEPEPEAEEESEKEIGEE